jgi:hypothetical protein
MGIERERPKFLTWEETLKEDLECGKQLSHTARLGFKIRAFPNLFGKRLCCCRRC